MSSVDSAGGGGGSAAAGGARTTSETVIYYHCGQCSPPSIPLRESYVLELNGFAFTASEEEAAQAVLALASGTMDEAGYMAFLLANATPMGSSDEILSQ